MVEVLHFMGGKDSPRRVLCPWLAHRLASTLPAVARATAVCFLRCDRGIRYGLDVVAFELQCYRRGQVGRGPTCGFAMTCDLTTW